MDGPGQVFVIGMGEVGRRLAGALRTAGLQVVPVTREQGWAEAVSSAAGPRLVAVREEGLTAVLDRLGGLDPGRLVLVQNGWIRPLLGQWHGCTRGLIWFTAKGEFFRVLRPSPLCGPEAASLAPALQRGGIPAVACGEEEFARLDAEKMGFNCVVGLPLAVHRQSLEEYLNARAAEAEALFQESVSVCAAAAGVEPDPSWWRAFLESAVPLGWVKVSAAKALGLRNAAVVRLAREMGAEAPVNARLLAALEEAH